MTPATSVTFFKREFQDFLYAPICTDPTVPELSVLSALARLGLDPWAEAAELTQLPADEAQGRLALLLEKLPADSWPRQHGSEIVARLLHLLPPRTELKNILPPIRRPARPPVRTKVSYKLLLAGALAATLLMALTLRAFPLNDRATPDPSPISDARPDQRAR